MPRTRWLAKATGESQRCECMQLREKLRDVRRCSFSTLLLWADVYIETVIVIDGVGKSSDVHGTIAGWADPTNW